VLNVLRATEIDATGPETVIYDPAAATWTPRRTAVLVMTRSISTVSDSSPPLGDLSQRSNTGPGGRRRRDGFRPNSAGPTLHQPVDGEGYVGRRRGL